MRAVVHARLPRGHLSMAVDTDHNGWDRLAVLAREVPEAEEWWAEPVEEDAP